MDKRHKLTRAERLELLNQDLTYTATQLDRDVVSESQIRTVLHQFRNKVLPDAFPGREEVPKTLIFAKDDSHADDIVRITRDVFDAGNDFCQKITYRTGFTKVQKTVTNEDGTQSEMTDWVKTSKLTPDEILANFRNSFYPRIAVTVERSRRVRDGSAGRCGDALIHRKGEPGIAATLPAWCPARRYPSRASTLHSSPGRNRAKQRAH